MRRLSSIAVGFLAGGLASAVWLGPSAPTFTITAPVTRTYTSGLYAAAAGMPSVRVAVKVTADRRTEAGDYAINAGYQAAGQTTAVAAPVSAITETPGPNLEATISHPQGGTFAAGDLVGVNWSGHYGWAVIPGELDSAFATSMNVTFVNAALSLRSKSGFSSQSTGPVTVSLNLLPDTDVPVALNSRYFTFPSGGTGVIRAGTVSV